jgi:Bacterial regulatory proteins, luxR family
VRTPALAALDAPDLTPASGRSPGWPRGLSNRGIAERLGIAARTVDNHLHRAYAKLGVGSRGELAPLLLGPRHDA